MTKNKLGAYWIAQTGRVGDKLRTALSILLISLLMMQVPAAFASDNYPEGDYLHHLWRLQDDARRDQEIYNSLYNSDRHASRFCAIAFSVKIDNWGYSWGKRSREEAEKEALKRCGGPDAEVLCWSKGNWYCALADGPNGYGGAPGETPAIAKAKAMKIANEHGTGNRIVLVVGGNPPIVKLGEKAEQQGSSRSSGSTGPRDDSFGLNLLKSGPRPRH